MHIDADALGFIINGVDLERTMIMAESEEGLIGGAGEDEACQPALRVTGV